MRNEFCNLHAKIWIKKFKSVETYLLSISLILPLVNGDTTSVTAVFWKPETLVRLNVRSFELEMGQKEPIHSVKALFWTTLTRSNFLGRAPDQSVPISILKQLIQHTWVWDYHDPCLSNINCSSSWSYKDGVTPLQDSVLRLSHGLLQQLTTKLEKTTKDTITNPLIINISKDLPVLQRVPQSLQYFGCEEIGYDLLHWLHISSK